MSCEIYLTAGATTGLNASTYTKLAFTSSLSQGLLFDNGGADNGRLRYTGTPTGLMRVSVAVSFTGTLSPILSLAITKNGTFQPASVMNHEIWYIAAATVQLQLLVSLATNDYLEIAAIANTGTPNCTLVNVNISAVFTGSG